MVNILIKRGDGVKDFIIKGKLMKSAVIRSLPPLAPASLGKEKGKEKRGKKNEKGKTNFF